MNDAANDLVDVVDDAGNVIGIVTRQQMRCRRLPHRCVYVLVFDSSGRLLVHQRTASKDLFPAYWDLCIGGVLAAGETFDDGARRESREELGIELDLKPLFPFRYSDDHTTVHAMVFQAVHNGPFQFQPEEVQSGRFIAIEELNSLVAQFPFCPDGLEVWREFLRTGRLECEKHATI